MDTINKLIYILDDEYDIRELLKLHLRKENYRTNEFATGKRFLRALENKIPDLVIMDLMLTDLNGIEICKIIRQNPQYIHMPIILLSARDSEIDIVLGLEIGADDYITKPFSAKELNARVKALLRRASHKHAKKTNIPTIKSYQGIHLNTTTHHVHVDLDSSSETTPHMSPSISLTLTEFKILSKLLENPTWVVSREVLLQYLWEDTKIVSYRTIDVHIKHLRDKLGKKQKHRIKNIRGVGYKLE